jgi:hypothetical protein
MKKSRKEKRALWANGGQLMEMLEPRLMLSGNVPLAQLTFGGGGVPQNSAAGNAIGNVSVGIFNSKGQLNTSDNSAVTLSICSWPGLISGTVTVHAVKGIATFSNVSIDNVGIYRLYAADGAINPTVSSLFTITPAAATHLVYAAPPGNTTAGVVYKPAVVVYAMDQFDNIVRNVNTPVTLKILNATALVYGASTVNLNNGAAIFNDVWLETAGVYEMAANALSLASIKRGFYVYPTTPAKIGFEPTPVGDKHGGKFVLGVVAEDVFGNIVTGDETGKITLKLNAHPTGAVLSGTLTVNVVNGLAPFLNLSINLAGTYSLAATDSFGIAGVTSGTFAVS